MDQGQDELKICLHTSITTATVAFSVLSIEHVKKTEAALFIHATAVAPHQIQITTPDKAKVFFWFF